MEPVSALFYNKWIMFQCLDRLFLEILVNATLQSICLSAYCRVFDTAWERDSTAFPAGVEGRAVEVDVQVPVIRPVSSAAGPLRPQQHELKHNIPLRKPGDFIHKQKNVARTCTKLEKGNTPTADGSAKNISGIV